MNPFIITGMPSVDMSLNDIIDPVKTLEQIFAYMEDSEKPCIVAVDEFQQIADYPDGHKVIAKLRTLVQSCRQTRFIFAGSNRRMMSDLFNSPSEPFFMSCTPIHLGPISREAYTEFVCRHFESAGKGISPECVEYVYDLFDGHTWFVRMSDRQRSLLIAIAKRGKVQAPTSVEFISRYGLRSASAVQGALRPLIKDETVSYVNGHYLISNRFFSLWLARRY